MNGRRFTAGPKNPNTCLDWDVVRRIRAEYSRGVSQGQLSRRFLVSVNTIGRIVRGETWQERGGFDATPTADNMTAMLERLKATQAEVNGQPPASSIPPSLDDLMRREAAKPDPAGEAALARLAEETRDPLAELANGGKK